MLKKQIRFVCNNEMNSLKPGNVHKYSAGHGMNVKDFIKSGEIISNYNKIIVVEDHKYQGSLCFELKHLAYELNYSGKIFGINLEDRFFKPGMLSDVLESEGFSENKLKERIDDLL